jgi:hypothetical protein
MSLIYVRFPAAWIGLLPTETAKGRTPGGRCAILPDCCSASFRKDLEL